MNKEDGRKLFEALAQVLADHGGRNSGVMCGFGPPEKPRNGSENDYYIPITLNPARGRQVPDNLRAALKKAYEESIGRAYDADEQRANGKTDIRINWNGPFYSEGPNVRL